MRLSTIAVCLLLVTPAPVLACFEHDPAQTKWIHEMRSSSRETAWAGVEEMRGDGTPDPWMLGAGSAAVALVVVSFRAFSRAAGRGPMPPACLAGGGDGDREAQAFRISLRPAAGRSI
jgi:hypothetical protein